MLAYLYCTAYTRMTMYKSSPPCEQRHITFNDDRQRVQLARPELPAPHYICMYRLLPTTPPSPSRHYYPRLIARINLPTPKGWIAWLAKADCTTGIGARPNALHSLCLPSRWRHHLNGLKTPPVCRRFTTELRGEDVALQGWLEYHRKIYIVS